MSSHGSFQDAIQQVARFALMLDPTGRVEAANPELAAFLGLELSTLVGGDWFVLTLPDDIREVVRGEFRRSITGQREHVPFYRVRLKDSRGALVAVEWHNFLRRDADGRIIGSFSLGDPVADVEETNLLEASHAETALPQLLKRLAQAQALIDHNPIALFAFRVPDGHDLAVSTLESVNTAGQSLLRDLPVAAIGQRPGPHTFTLPWEPLCEALITCQDPRVGTVHLPEVHELAAPDQGRVFSVRAFRLDQNTVGLSAEDVTEAWRAKVETTRQAQFLETVLDHIPDMVFVKEAKELRFVRFNRAGEALLGVSRDDLIGRNDRDLFPPDEAEFFIAKDREVLATGGVLEIPEEPIHTRGGIRTLHTKKIGVHDETGAPLYLLGISEDITDRRLAERELDRRTAQLEQSNRDLEQFAYIASHDLQEPLRKVRQFGDLLAEILGANLAAEPADVLRRMQASAARMQALITDLLALSRVNSRGEVARPVDLELLMKELLQEKAEEIAACGAQVEIADLPIVLGDRVQLNQLFTNLIGNAIKFRSPERRLEIHVSSRPVAPGLVEIAVRDNGIGFAPQDATRILQPFQRLHGRTEYEGTGMGLAICRRVAERHGGSLFAEGRPGEGATFHVSLPTTSATP